MHTHHRYHQHWINSLLLLGVDGQHNFSALTSSSHRAAVVWGLRPVFLSRPVEIGLMKFLTLSECRLWHPSSSRSSWSRPSHLWLNLCLLHPSPSLCFPSTHCLHLQTLKTALHCKSGLLLPCFFRFRVCSTSLHGGAPFMRQSKNK